MSDTRIVVFARAPVPGATKTRLIPLLGPAGAAELQRLLIERTLATAIRAAIGTVELWCEPTAHHPLLTDFLRRHGVDGVTQCDGDLGARMHHAAIASLASAPSVIFIGTDCPALTAADLSAAAEALAANDAVLIPAEDGGYVLLGLNRWDAQLFTDIEWGANQVLSVTRARLAALNWRWQEFPALWDVDRPEDYLRLRESGLMPELAETIALPRGF